ncbi:MAG: AAA family ATPase [Clostridia bacterium]|nr:AAA family ATPase [Clostridia bacterium]
MFIRKLYIKEYGALLDREFVFTDGINLLEGGNESGKSTVLSFIRFVLYGMPRRAAGETVSEREKGLSWQNSVAEGSMEILSLGKGYRIERKGYLRGNSGRETYAEDCHIFDLETGAEILKGVIPGKHFLGITAEMFTATTCIRQLECTSVDGDEVNSSLENLLFSADEEIDTQKVQAKLDDLRRALLHKNGKGGKLFELETAKTLLENRLDTAKKNAQDIIAKEATVERLKAVSEKAKKQYEEAEEQLRLYETASKLRRFETLHSYEAQYEEQERALDKLCREKGYQGALPDRETLGVIDRFASALSEAIQKHRFSLTALAQAEHAPCGDRELARFYQKTDEEGGKQTLCAAFLRATRKRKNAITRAVILLVLAVLGFAAGALTLLTDLFAAFYGYMPFLLYGLLGAGALFTLFGILSFSAAAKARKKRIALVTKIGLPGKPTGTSFEAHIETCRKNHELCAVYDATLARAKSESEQASRALEGLLANTARMLSSVGVSCETATPEATLECLKSTYDTFFAVCNERESIEGKMNSLHALIEELKETLKDVSEGALSASVGRQKPSVILASLDIEKIRFAHDYSKTQHTLNEQKKIALEKELIALTSTAENPARVSAKLDETVGELETHRLKYDAIRMAHETLGIASENLRRSVTPTLRLRAGELMSGTTGGKYRDLGISGDMKITVMTDHTTRSIEALSKGTRDAAYLSLRLALAEMVCRDNMPPLLFDESFTQLDVARTRAMLSMLTEYSAGGTQTLIFTCHKREGEMLKELGMFNHIHLDA